MLECDQSSTSVKLIVTLTEKQTIAGPYYLFVFENVLTRDIVTKIFSSADDESDYKTRYNQFDINPAILFADKQRGEWHYQVYEQESNDNTDPTASGALLEDGKMMLLNEKFEYDQYNEATAFKSYEG